MGILGRILKNINLSVGVKERKKKGCDEMSAVCNYEELNPECFIYEEYEPDWWELLGTNQMSDIQKNIFSGVLSYVIGYCDAKRLSFRPRDNSYAVMFEKDGRKFWFHVNKRMMEAI